MRSFVDLLAFATIATRVIATSSASTWGLGEFPVFPLQENAGKSSLFPMPLCNGFKLEEATIDQMQAALKNGTLTSVQLVLCYMQRNYQTDDYIKYVVANRGCFASKGSIADLLIIALCYNSTLMYFRLQQILMPSAKQEKSEVLFMASHTLLKITSHPKTRWKRLPDHGLFKAASFHVTRMLCQSCEQLVPSCLAKQHCLSGRI